MRLLLALFYVFAKPVSMVLDRYLGEDMGTVFTKSQVGSRSLSRALFLVPSADRLRLTGARSSPR